VRTRKERFCWSI